jgi:hypothetical protein
VVEQEDPGRSQLGVVRVIVVMSAFALATAGALTAYFLAKILAAAADSAPSDWAFALCAATPLLIGAGSAALSLRARTVGAVLASGCGSLLLGMVASIIVIAAVVLG